MLRSDGSCSVHYWTAVEIGTTVLVLATLTHVWLQQSGQSDSVTLSRGCEEMGCGEGSPERKSFPPKGDGPGWVSVCEGPTSYALQNW